MKKYRYYILFIVILAVGLGFSFYKRMDIQSVTYQNVFNNAKEMLIDEPYSTFMKERNYYFTSLYDNDMYETLDEIMEKADAVCVVSLVETIQETRGAVKSTLHVEDVWKSDIEVGSRIDVFEQYFIDQDYRIVTTGGVLPMQKNKQYVVFLNKYDEYKNDHTYGFSSMLYDKFVIKEDVSILNMNGDIGNTSIYKKQWDTVDIVQFDLSNDLQHFRKSEDEYEKEKIPAIESYLEYQETYMNMLKEIYDKLDMPLRVTEVTAIPIERDENGKPIEMSDEHSVL